MNNIEGKKSKGDVLYCLRKINTNDNGSNSDIVAVILMDDYDFSQEYLTREIPTLEVLLSDKVVRLATTGLFSTREDVLQYIKNKIKEQERLRQRILQIAKKSITDSIDRDIIDSLSWKINSAK